VATYGLKDAARGRAALRLQGDAVGFEKLSPMVPMPNMECSDLTYRIDALIPPKTVEFRGSPDKLIVSGILKLLIGKSFHQWTLAA
jgi:hypothetical protein